MNSKLQDDTPGEDYVYMFPHKDKFFWLNRLIELRITYPDVKIHENVTDISWRELRKLYYSQILK